MEEKWKAKTIYLFAIIEAYDDRIAFNSIEDAYDYAYNYLIDSGYDPTDDKYEVFKDLKKNFESDGFYINEILWCYSIPLYEKSENN